MEKSEKSQRTDGDHSSDPSVASIFVAVDNSHRQTHDSRRVKLRNLRIDAMLGVAIGSIIVLFWIVFDIGDRLDTLSTNVSTLTQELIQP